MPRAMQLPSRSRRAIAGAVGLAGVLSLLPPRWMGWADSLRGVALVAIAPVSHPAAALGAWLGPRTPNPALPADLDAARGERDRFEALYLRELQENMELRARITQLQQGLSASEELPFRLLAAPVVGHAADLAHPLLIVGAGAGSGAAENAVATVDGVQIVGRVVDVDARTCLVRPITARAGSAAREAARIDGVIVGSDGDLTCRLYPIGEGLLQGTVDYRRTAQGEPAAAREGDIVRLADSTWPRNARMLVLGRVTAISRSPADPLRSIITVTPTVDVERVSEVVLRVNDPGDRP